MKTNQYEHCLIILMFRKTWLILYPFPASLGCQAVSQGPPCLDAKQNLVPLLLSYLPSLQHLGSFESYSGAPLFCLEGGGISGMLLISSGFTLSLRNKDLLITPVSIIELGH